MKNLLIILLFALLSPLDCLAENPISNEWYADPEALEVDGEYWIYPTTSTDYEKQTHFDAFSSKDLVNWVKHKNILDAKKDISWFKKALWAPSVIEKDGKFYLFFSCNDHKPSKGNFGGIGVAVADSPKGPFKDLLGKPLICQIENGAQPIDQFVFKYKDEYFMYYGGWGHCNLVKLADDFKSLKAFDDGKFFREATPENYVEGPFLFERKGKWYFMWSEGNWTDSSYRAAYAIADSPFGPFKREATILSIDEKIATGAGHHSVVKARGGDNWFIVYHRRPIPNESSHHRVVCIDKMQFTPDGKIKPVKMTFEGVGKTIDKK